MSFRFTKLGIAVTATALILSACGGGGGGDSTTPVVPPVVTPSNTGPQANAGLAQSVYVGALATLDGSKSTDVDGDPLTYKWELSSKPAGSAAVLSSSTDLKPTFTPDVAGEYVATLFVNDGKADSAPVTVTITASVLNLAPVANAGVAQNVNTGAVVSLNGAGSTDANGDPITYSWSLTSPAGSTATLSGSATAAPQFTADLVGSYVASLVVSDGTLSSAPASVTVVATVANVAPVADAGANRTVIGSTLVTLDSSASSDANGDALTYRWSLTSVPAGSVAALSSLTASSPSFTPDVVGNYVAQLIVNDGQADSAPATVTISYTQNLVINGSFENGLASWTSSGVQATMNPGVNPHCSYNVTTAPGTETASGNVGFPSTEGSQVVVGSSQSDSGYYNCVLYQDIAIPSDANGLTFNLDLGNRFIGTGAPCLFIGLYSTASVPGYESPVVGNQALNYCSRTDTALAAQSVTYSATDIQALKGTTVRLALINAMYGPGTGLIGADNIRIIPVP